MGRPPVQPSCPRADAALAVRRPADFRIGHVVRREELELVDELSSSPQRPGDRRPHLAQDDGRRVEGPRRPGAERRSRVLVHSFADLRQQHGQGRCEVRAGEGRGFECVLRPHGVEVRGVRPRRDQCQRRYGRGDVGSGPRGVAQVERRVTARAGILAGKLRDPQVPLNGGEPGAGRHGEGPPTGTRPRRRRPPRLAPGRLCVSRRGGRRRRPFRASSRSAARRSGGPPRRGRGPGLRALLPSSRRRAAIGSRRRRPTDRGARPR
ncbi:hypothetical protein ACCUM_2692 [Candidatus Accumulibacter phosphatis]|uniref:Uncharacterized protein n=1 Tax=Candidatus Accumulibacter phosphatis TaxID=327160 RepID=A0A5S4EQV7_9PROT|nr:hypothetical protein ACCUM_2692 [Candidatus Accumulibacter phosphatis]